MFPQFNYSLTTWTQSLKGIFLYIFSVTAVGGTLNLTKEKTVLNFGIVMQHLRYLAGWRKCAEWLKKVFLGKAEKSVAAPNQWPAI